MFHARDQAKPQSSNFLRATFHRTRSLLLNLNEYKSCPVSPQTQNEAQIPRTDPSRLRFPQLTSPIPATTHHSLPSPPQLQQKPVQFHGVTRILLFQTERCVAHPLLKFEME
jgi:hypothetical protein